MSLLTDLKKIKKLVQEKEDENWEFRTFLKCCDSDKVDDTVHALYREISSQVECSECANCCRESLPGLDREDIEKFAAGLGISTEDLREQFLTVDGEGDFVFNKLPCPFLKNNKCSNYINRPKDCGSYPHLHQKGMIFHLIGMIQRCSVCPITFYVYECLKQKFGFRVGST